MKIAIFHNFLDNIGGAEMVALCLARDLEADIYTTNFDAEKISKMGYSDVTKRIKSIGKIPKQAPFRQQLAFWKFRRLNLKGQYDFFIIAGDWAMSAAVNNKPNLWYVHSPLNELWAFKNFIKQELLSAWKKPIYEFWVWFNRILSRRYAKSIGILICNSANTQQRIKKYYGQEAKIIYPPVDTEKYQNKNNGDYWLSVNRLATHKRVEMQIEAFRSMPDKKLIIVGSYEKGAKQFEDCKNFIEQNKPDNVIIKHWLSQEELLDLYANCRGFICTSKDEDFGLTAIEAMASGKPVITPNEGGYRESIINGQTGYLIDNISAEKIIDKILATEKKLKEDANFFQEASQNRAASFDRKIFIEKIKKAIIK